MFFCLCPYGPLVFCTRTWVDAVMACRLHHVPRHHWGFHLPWILPHFLLISFALLVLSSTWDGITANGEDLTGCLDFQDLKTPFPYDFPNLKNAASLFPMRLCNGIPLEEATIESLQSAMRLRRLKSSQLALCYLQRIYQTDSYIEYVLSLLPASSNRIKLGL